MRTESPMGAPATLREFRRMRQRGASDRYTDGIPLAGDALF